MAKYVVALFCDLCEHSGAWTQIPEAQMAGLLGEYKALAEKVASQHGSFHHNFTGDGHLFLFENADAAVRFGLKLIAAWHGEFETSPALRGLAPIPLRVGAHFGVDRQIGDGEAWVGRVNNVAKRIEDAAAPDTLFMSEGMLDLIDFPLYQVERVRARALRGDCVARRVLYRVDSFDEAASAAKPADELTDEEWLLRAAAMIGTEKENTEEEEHCYVEALRLRPHQAEAHNNYGVLLMARGDRKRAEEHYLEALRLRPEYAEAHNNYANLLNSRTGAKRADMRHAEEHYLEALRLRRDYAEAHCNYAVLLGRRGDVKHRDVDCAREHYAKALDLRPDYAEAHSNYAGLLKETGDVKGAEGHLGEALRLEPDYAIGHYNYATLLQQKGDARGAEDHYRRAYELDPSHLQIKSAFEGRVWER